MQKQKGVAKLTVGIFAVVIFAVAIFAGPSILSWASTGEIYNPPGDGPWADKLVDFQLITTDKFAGTDESATVKVYDEEPEDYGNPRGTFTDASLYTSYTASSGVVTINKEYPGTYYCVGTVTSSNTEFLKVVIPDGTGLGDLSDYNTEPDADVMDFSAVGSTTDEDFALTLTNETDADVKDSLTLTVADSTELRGWKVIVDDTEGYSVDADGDGTYDEGIKAFEVCVCGTCDLFFKPANGIDKLDSNDEYTFEILSCKVQDGNDVTVAVDIDANTGDYTGANDEIWGEGEGILAYIKIYDNEGNLFSTVDVTA